MMRPLLNLSVVVLFVSTSISCNSTKNTSGTYHSKFAVGGFFGTRVVLYSDSTFTYRMQGDLLYDTAVGKYQIKQKFVKFIYKPLDFDTSREYTSTKETLSIHEAMTSSKNLREPSMYIVGHNKLFLSDSSGVKVTRQWGFSKNKRYILFGKHWYYKRFYLKKTR